MQHECAGVKGVAPGFVGNDLAKVLNLPATDPDLMVSLVPAQEQLQLALKAGDGDFYAMSRIDARLREVRQRMAEEKRQR